MLDRNFQVNIALSSQVGNCSSFSGIQLFSFSGVGLVWQLFNLIHLSMDSGSSLVGFGFSLNQTQFLSIQLLGSITFNSSIGFGPPGFIIINISFHQPIAGSSAVPSVLDFRSVPVFSDYSGFSRYYFGCWIQFIQFKFQLTWHHHSIGLAGFQGLSGVSINWTLASIQSIDSSQLLWFQLELHRQRFGSSNTVNWYNWMGNYWTFIISIWIIYYYYYWN